MAFLRELVSPTAYLSGAVRSIASGRRMAALLLLSSALVGRTALGLIVMNIDPTPNYSAPTLESTGFATNPDPGWNNITGRGIYLGNQWVLAPYHTTGGGLPATEWMQTEDGIITYTTVPGSLVRLKNTIVDLDEDGKDDNTGITAGTDLMMYRIDTTGRYDGTPEQMSGGLIKPITISGNSPPSNTQLMVMGQGRVRNNNTLYHWDKANNNAPWTGGGPCVDCFHDVPVGSYHAVGYQTGSTEKFAWGTNRVESITSQNFPTNPDDPNYVIVVPGSASRAVKGGAGYTMMQIMDFDEYSFTVDEMGVIRGGGNEAQAAGGDSGSAVFRRNGNNWELTGLVHSIASYIHTSRSVAIRQGTQSGTDLAFGDITMFSDLSKYRGQIMDLLGDTNYSILGDINLDGQVSGDGTGSWETDDVTALIMGWGYQHSGAPDIISWKYGDLNRDGVVDLADFVELRNAMGASGAGLELASLLGSISPGVVPEPATWLLLAGGAGLLGWRRWRGRRVTL